MRRALLLCVSALAGCGGFTDEGDGSKTLEVQAYVSFEQGTATVDARVSVDQNGAFVSGAIVKLRDDETDDEFTLEEDGNFYRAHIAGDYRRKLVLDITRGDDDLEAKLEGPGKHFIITPFEGTSIDLGDDPMKVEWSVEDGIRADDVSISVDNSDYRGETNEDKGKVEIPRELLRPGDDTIRVTRANSVDLKGGRDSSTFEISYEAISRVRFEE